MNRRAMGDKIEKKYFSIGEVADQLKVSASLIRFWETQFEEVKPRKNKNGVRQYTKSDIEVLHTIYHLVKEKGYTLGGAKEMMKEKPTTNLNETVEIITRLENAKAFFKRLKVGIENWEAEQNAENETEQPIAPSATTSFE